MRTIKTIIYLAMLAGAALLGWPRWSVLLTILASPASYFREVPFWPLWLLLGLGVLGYGVYFGVGWLLRLRIAMMHHFVVLGLFTLVLLVRVLALLSPSAGPDWKAPEDAPPHWRMAQAAGRLQLQIERAALQQRPGRYPEDSAVVEAFLAGPEGPPRSGYLHHGLPAAVRLVVVRQATGPVRAVQPDDLPGTLYYAVANRGAAYWITAVGLARYPTGPSIVMAGPDQETLVLGSDPSKER